MASEDVRKELGREEDPPAEAAAMFGTLAAARLREGAAHAREETAGERAHPHPAEYVKIALALAVITLLEVAAFYLDLSNRALVPILVVLSATKFALVALWYMHLKFDSRVFSWLFALGMILAAAVFIAAWSTLDILL